jgi:hypothetical protein
MAELVALLSLGTDLGLGQPMEHMIPPTSIWTASRRASDGSMPPGITTAPTSST